MVIQAHILNQYRRIQTGLIYSTFLALFILLFLYISEALNARNAFLTILSSIIVYFLWYLFYPYFSKDEKKEKIL